MREAQNQGVPDFRGVHQTVRPARVATLLRESPDWPDHALRILENYSRLWGGVGNIIVPCTETGDLDKEFVRVLRAFDPDCLHTYHPTWRDEEIARPEEAAKRLSKQIEWEKANVGGLDDEAAAHVARERLRLIRLNWKLSSSARKALDANLPIYRPFEGMPTPVAADQEPGHSLVDVCSLRSVAEHALVVVQAEDDWQKRLHQAALFGGLSPSHRKRLEEVGCPLVAPPVAGVDLVTASLRPDKLKWLPDTAFGRTLTGCTYWEGRSSLFARYSDTHVVIGSSVRDFCYFLSLNRLTGRAVWFPDSNVKLTDLTRLDIAVRGDRSCRMLITSLTESVGTLAGLRERLAPLGLPKQVGVVKPSEINLENRRRIQDEAVVRRTSYEPFEGELQKSRINTVLPSIASFAEPGKLCWFVDVHVDGYSIPPRAELAPMLRTDSEHDLIRCSQGDITFSSVPIMSIGGQLLEHSVQRPRLRLVTVVEAANALLAPHLLEARMSDKGAYLSDALDRWGDDVADLAADLSNPPVYSALTAFLPRTELGLTIRGDCFLSFEELKAASGMSDEELAALIDRFLQSGILRYGFALKCRYCRFAAWYDADGVGKDFCCTRCRESQVMTSASWREPLDGPVRRYQLAEVVFQFLRNNGHVPVLALQKAREKCFAFGFAPELEVWRTDCEMKKPSCEVDLWIVRDGELWIGECKANAEINKAGIRSLACLARKTRADAVLLATTEPAWSSGTLARSQMYLEKAGIKVVYFTGLGGQGQPGNEPRAQ